jgi:hypothetical protein
MTPKPLDQSLVIDQRKLISQRLGKSHRISYPRMQRSSTKPERHPQRGESPSNLSATTTVGPTNSTGRRKNGAQCANH